MSVVCLSVKQRFAHIIDCEFLTLFLSVECGTHGSPEDYDIEEELFYILRFREEIRRCEVLLELL